MIDHARARELSSAEADGTATKHAGELSRHLDGCAECRAFAAGIDRLRVLAAALPRDRAPAGFTERVVAALPQRRRVLPLRSWRLAPALAVALGVVLVVLFRPATRFDLPHAEAAEALARIRTLYVEREIEMPDGATTRERIWFRAPGSVRIERTTEGGPFPRLPELVIERPGERYTKLGAIERYETGLPPAIDLPEPLSPAVVLIGRDAGAGPTVAGRPTRRVEASLPDGSRRVAFVDVSRFTVLGGEDAVVLGKEAFGPEGAPVSRKTTTALRYNEEIRGDLFRIPDAPPSDLGFRTAPPSSLRTRPRAIPEGFRLVRAGRGPDGEALLYTKGALRILVEEGFRQLAISDAVQVGGTDGVASYDLYETPVVAFTAGIPITVSAPLPPEALAGLAAEMFGL